jgi:hypothetical protein
MDNQNLTPMQFVLSLIDNPKQFDQITRSVGKKLLEKDPETFMEIYNGISNDDITTPIKSIPVKVNTESESATKRVMNWARDVVKSQRSNGERAEPIAKIMELRNVDQATANAIYDYGKSKKGCETASWSVKSAGGQLRRAFDEVRKQNT